MPRKPLELPLAVARAFVRDMRAFFAVNTIKADAIAAWQLYAPKPRQEQAEANGPTEPDSWPS